MLLVHVHMRLERKANSTRAMPVDYFGLRELARLPFFPLCGSRRGGCVGAIRRPRFEYRALSVLVGRVGVDDVSLGDYTFWSMNSEGSEKLVQAKVNRETNLGALKRRRRKLRVHLTCLVPRQYHAIAEHSRVASFGKERR